MPRSNIANIFQVFGNSQEFQYEDEASHARNKEQAFIGIFSLHLDMNQNEYECCKWSIV